MPLRLLQQAMRQVKDSLLGTKWFLVVCRRLERGRFQWLQSFKSKTLTVERRQLQWLLQGLTIEQKQAHFIDIGDSRGKDIHDGGSKFSPKEAMLHKEKAHSRQNKDGHQRMDACECKKMVKNSVA